MIHFHCGQCGMKFRVQDEFAGRSTRCPTCKQPLLVPQPEVTAAYVPPAGPIPGSVSSLDQAGYQGGVTLDSGPSAPGGASVAVRLASVGRQAGRYVIEKEIARGGMGAVLRALDRDIHREVAVKYMLGAADPRQKARFVEEAQITGQLEHPNIVPIHELGLDAQQRLFFAMKLVQGRSLAQVQQGLRDQPKAAAKEWPLSRLLTILVSVCNALAYAHSRGVVHRDLKPANIMVGDFGEAYVMDWGLAKVLRGAGPATDDTAAAYFASISAPDPSREASKITTSRADDTDLTQEGAVMGTPAYMPPEQARGQVQAIDARSDVYALGAILYETLTLQPPVDRTGDYLQVLRRVAEGDIQPPEQRTPERARQGLIPRELSAIALKALAREPGGRYPSAEALRRDIELYQEGRSVSAKLDTRWELLVKFVRRNRAFSATASVALVVLLVVVSYFLRANYAARVYAEGQQQKAEKAYEDFQAEQWAKERAIRESLPAFLRSARQLANEGDLREGQRQVELSLLYQADNAEARLLKGELLVAQKNWQAAGAEFDRYLRLRPRDDVARRLRELSAKGQGNEIAALFEVAQLLQGHKLFGPAARLLQELEGQLKTREPLLALYRKQLQAHWPGASNQLKLSQQGQLGFWMGKQPFPDLLPLKGIPLEILHVDGWFNLNDIEPIRGMPLLNLNLAMCNRIRDLRPLQGMPLRELELSRIDSLDLEPLRRLALTKLNLSGSGVRDLSPLEGIPLVWLNLYGCPQIKDLGPLRGLPLNWLNIGRTRVNDLSPLRGLPLTWLELHELGGIESLEPLRGIPLTYLHCHGCLSLRDLAPLQGMPLKDLDLQDCRQVRDVSPLEGMKLEKIGLSPATIAKGMDGLRRMPSLQTIQVRGAGISPVYPVAEFWKRYDAGEFRK